MTLSHRVYDYHLLNEKCVTVRILKLVRREERLRRA